MAPGTDARNLAIAGGASPSEAPFVVPLETSERDAQCWSVAQGGCAVVRSYCRRGVLYCAFTASVATSMVASAQQPPAEPAEQPDAPGKEAPPEAPTVSPPVLQRFVEARWPDGEPVAQSEPVTVLFDLTIGTDGTVTSADIRETAGAAFDAAAREAVMAFQFEPAKRGTEPISVRIGYRYEFLPPGPATAGTEGEPDAPASSDGAAAASSNATHATPSPAPARASSGQAPSTERAPTPSAQQGAALPPPELSYGATVEIDAPPREVTKRTVQKEQLMKIPGTGGDALRAIEVMPGVARTSIDDGDVILRGAAWNESQAFVNGVDSQMLYHFGGTKSSFNSHLLERVDLYPGNFSARYGRATGGIVEARVREPRRDKMHGILEASFLDSMALVETPVGDSAAVAFAGRRSNVDFFFEEVVPDDAYSVLAAPLYWDYQAIGVADLGRDHKLHLLGYGSSDTLELLFSEPNENDAAIRGSVDVLIRYHRAQAELESDLGHGVSQKLQLTYGRTRMRQMFGPLRAQMAFHELYSRAEWSAEASDSLRVNFGFDVEGDIIEGYYIGNRPPQGEGEGNQTGLSGEEFAVVDTNGDYSIGSLRPAAYVETEWRPTKPLLLVPGVRADYYGDTKDWTVDPRFSARLDVSEHTALKGGVGLHSQNPEYYEVMKELGNPKLEPYHALHFGLGVEHRPVEQLELGLEGFYKYLYNRVVSTPGGAPPSFVNDGTGRIYGGELFVRYSDERTTAWLAYTLSRSERNDRDEGWRLFEQDQTHILALTATTKLGRGWELGGRFRLTSGDPTTPVVAAIYDTGLDVYRPIDGDLYSERSPLYHQLDVRVEKQWDMRGWTLATYLDLQNAYNAENVLGESYSYDYSQSEKVTGLPVFPNLGIRGEI